MNVSLKNRMGTESHGGDGGLLEDREDGEDRDTVTAAPLRDTERRSFSPGGGRRAGGAVCGGMAAAPSEEQKTRREMS